MSRTREEERKYLLEQAVLEYGEDVLRLAYLFLGDSGLAEDAGQQTFLQVYRSLHRFRGEASMRTWVMRIAVNTCKNMRRSRAYGAARAEVPLERAADTADNREFFSGAEGGRVWEAIQSLPPKYADVLILRYYRDYSGREMAAILGLPQATVRTRLRRAHEKMRMILSERSECDGESDYRSCAQ